MQRDSRLHSPKRADIYEHPNPLVRWTHWRRLALALKLCPPEQETVLDLGTGRVLLLPGLLARCHRVYATDIDRRRDGDEFQDWAKWQSFLWWAGEGVAKGLGLRAGSRLGLLYADGAHLSLKPESLDIVFCLDLLEHMPPKLRHLTIAECYRVLRPGGS
jgi:SAM-dependent methyltransferase